MNCFKCNLATFNLHVSESENEKGKPRYRSQASLVYNLPTPRPLFYFFLYVEAFWGGNSTFKQKKKKISGLELFLKREGVFPRLGLFSASEEEGRVSIMLNGFCLMFLECE